MKTLKTWRKYTADEILDAYVANPRITGGGNPIAEMVDGKDICFDYVNGNQDNGWQSGLVVVVNGHGAGFLEMDEEDFEAALEITERMRFELAE